MVVVQCNIGHRREVVALEVDYRSNTLFSASADSTVRVWDLDTISCRRTLPCVTGHITGIRICIPSSDIGEHEGKNTTFKARTPVSAKSSPFRCVRTVRTLAVRATPNNQGVAVVVMATNGISALCCVVFIHISLFLQGTWGIIGASRPKSHRTACRRQQRRLCPRVLTEDA